jgi:hypothetical protein
MKRSGTAGQQSQPKRTHIEFDADNPEYEDLEVFEEAARAEIRKKFDQLTQVEQNDEKHVQIIPDNHTSAMWKRFYEYEVELMTEWGLNYVAAEKVIAKTEESDQSDKSNKSDEDSDNSEEESDKSDKSDKSDNSDEDSDNSDEESEEEEEESDKSDKSSDEESDKSDEESDKED